MSALVWQQPAAIRWGWFDLPLSILLDLFVVVLVLLLYVLGWVMYPTSVYVYVHSLDVFFHGFPLFARGHSISAFTSCSIFKDFRLETVVTFYDSV